MEHLQPHHKLVIAILTLCVCLVTGCKSEDPNPEISDPIYNDLAKQLKENESEVKDQEKKLEDLKANLEKMESRDPKRRRAVRDKFVNEKLLTQMQQRRLYNEIRSEQRKEYDKRAYHDAFKNDKPWPPVGEREEYEEIRKLKNAPRSWDAHVPKMTRNLKKAPVAVGKAEKKEEAPKKPEGAAE